MPALHVLATLVLALIAIASLPVAGWLAELALASLVAGFASVELLLRWIGRSLAWGLPHHASEQAANPEDFRWRFR